MTEDTIKPTLRLYNANSLDAIRDLVRDRTGEDLTPEAEEEIRQALGDGKPSPSQG
jgi:hypothetical protein